MAKGKISFRLKNNIDKIFKKVPGKKDMDKGKKYVLGEKKIIY